MRQCLQQQWLLVTPAQHYAHCENILQRFYHCLRQKDLSTVVVDGDPVKIFFITDFDDAEQAFFWDYCKALGDEGMFLCKEV